MCDPRGEGDILTTCIFAIFHLVTLAAACMTWELAESGDSFITSIINGDDLVPTFSVASVDDLCSEVVILRIAYWKMLL